MGISVEQWRDAISSYDARKSCSLACSLPSSRDSALLTVLCFVAVTLQQAVTTALMLLILLSGDVERNPGPDIFGCRPTLHQLTDFPGKSRHLNIAVEIGDNYHAVGIALLSGEGGIVLPIIVSEHRGNVEQINVDILSCWVQGNGMPDRTWRGLLRVLKVCCPKLAQEIEDTLRAEKGSSTCVHESLVEQEGTQEANQSSDSVPVAVAGEFTQHATNQQQSAKIEPIADNNSTQQQSTLTKVLRAICIEYPWQGMLGIMRILCPELVQVMKENQAAKQGIINTEPKVEPDSVPLCSHSATATSDSISLSAHSETTSQQLPTVQPFQSNSKPSLEECFTSAGIPADGTRLDESITHPEDIAEIAKKLTRWRDLSPHLQLEEYELEEIEASGNIGEQKRRMLTMWTKKFGSSATYRNLCTILWSQDRLDLVQTVCSALKTTVSKMPSIPTKSHSILSQLSEELRDRYAKHPLSHFSNPRCMKWMHHDKEKYIHPEIISKEEQAKQTDEHKEKFLCQMQRRITKFYSQKPVQLTELLSTEPGEKCKVVLVEGAPGIGKSTLAWQVCHLWGKRELFDQYSVVLLLPLRDKRVQEAKEVEDLILHLRDKEAREEIKCAIGSGSGTLVILDGLDELPDHLLSDQSIFTDLLSGEVLSDATILVTSRPSATQQLQVCWKQQITKHLVICGFTENDIHDYVVTTLSSEQLQEFEKYLSHHPHIDSIMYVPLHCAIVMAVYLQCKSIPKTLTELYTWLVKIILSQYITDHPEYNKHDRVLDKTLILRLPGQVQAYFRELCKFAYENVCSQKLIFSDLPEELHELGFTDSVPELFLPQSSSYNFLHLTIQEFLAAYYVSHMSPHEQEQLLLSSREEDKDHFMNTMRFVVGLTKFEGFSKEALLLCKQGVKNVYNEVKKEFEEEVILDDYSLQLLYECQDVISSNRECICYTSSDMHHDLGYCIANSRLPWKLYFSQSTTSRILFQGLTDNKIEPAYTIEDICLCENLVDIIISRAPKHFFARIKGLTIYEMEGWNIEYFLAGCSTNYLLCLHQWLSTTQLETLTVPLSSTDHLGTLSAMLTLTAPASLKALHMEASQFTLQVQDVDLFVFGLNKIQSLTELDIKCKTDSESFCYLVEALHNNVTLKVLKIREPMVNYIPIQGMLGFSQYSSSSDERMLDEVLLDEVFELSMAKEVLNQSSGIVETLNMIEQLRHNIRMEIPSTKGERKALAMVEMLEHNTTLEVLDLSGNCIGSDGAQAMADMLKHNTTLLKLNLSGNFIGTRGALQLAEMLQHNAVLRELDLSQNSAGGWGARAMAEVLKDNIALRVLNMSRNSIDDCGAVSMAKMLKHNTTLRVLNMSGNSTLEGGAITMAEMLKHNAALRVLNLSGNFTIRDQGALAMAEMLKINTTLEELILEETTIGVKERTALLESLKVNHDLKRLLLSDVECHMNDNKEHIFHHF